MSSLTVVEKKSLEKFLRMSGGWVLDFNDRSFGEFIEETTSLSIHAEIYTENGTSKAKKLRMFWKLESDLVVKKLLYGLIDYAMLPENKPDHDTIELENRCREIAARLGRMESQPPPNLAPPIFINYRRDDASAEALLVRDILTENFGANSVFMDVSSIKPGTLWPTTIEGGLRQASVVLVILGPSWLKEGKGGSRRIDNESDWVRREIEHALNHGQKIIPLLVKGARVPPSTFLPQSIQGLLHYQAIEIRSTYWDHDIRLLVETLKSGSIFPIYDSDAFKSAVPKESSRDDIMLAHDLGELSKLFKWINLDIMDDYIDRLYNEGRLTNAGSTFFERFWDFINSSKFHFYDKKLKSRVKIFARAWCSCQNKHFEMNQHPNGRESYYDIDEYSDHRYAQERREATRLLSAKAPQLRRALDAFISYVRTDYLQFDIESASLETMIDYRREEADFLTMHRLKLKLDREM